MEESLVPMDVESQQILNHEQDSTFRSLVAQHIERSVEEYRTWNVIRVRVTSLTKTLTMLPS